MHKTLLALALVSCVPPKPAAPPPEEPVVHVLACPGSGPIYAYRDGEPKPSCETPQQQQTVPVDAPKKDCSAERLACSGAHVPSAEEWIAAHCTKTAARDVVTTEGGDRYVSPGRAGWICDGKPYAEPPVSSAFVRASSSMTEACARYFRCTSDKQMVAERNVGSGFTDRERAEKCASERAAFDATWSKRYTSTEAKKAANEADTALTRCMAR